MKKAYILPITIVLMLTTFHSCAAIGEIFKAGMGFGIFLVIAVIVGISIFVMKTRKK